MKFSKNAVLKKLKDPLSGWQTALLVLLASLGYLIRASQYLFKPQLFAEDGVLWLAEGHNKSLTALVQPVNGFYHITERLFGYTVAHLSLSLAPLIFVTTAWAFFGLLAYYLFSPRTKIFTTNYERIFMLLSLILVSNIYELFFNFSNSIFLIGIIGALIMTARSSRWVVVNICEKIFFVLTCLTLPFCWFFVPIGLFEKFKYKRKDSFFLYAAIAGSILQAVRYITTHVSRSPVTLFSLLSKYTLLEIYNQMFIPALRFSRQDIPIAEYSAHRFPVFTVFLSMFVLLVATIVVIKRSNKQVWYLLFFLAGMTFASIKSPTLSVKLPVDALKTMAVVVGGSRYFVYGVLFVSIILVKISTVILMPKARYACMAIFIAFGLLTSLHYQTFFVEKQFKDYTAQYNKGIKEFDAGKKFVDIPSNPSSWHIILTK